MIVKIRRHFPFFAVGKMRNARASSVLDVFKQADRSACNVQVISCRLENASADKLVESEEN